LSIGFAGTRKPRTAPAPSSTLDEACGEPPEIALGQLLSAWHGLAAADAALRLSRDGTNELVQGGRTLATQSLVVFVIRTRRVPFFSSRPSRPLLGGTLAVVAVGIVIPYSPLAHVLGFRPLPLLFLAILAALAATYLALAELAKSYFFHSERRRDARGGLRKE